MAKLFSKAKKGQMSGNKVVGVVLSVIVLAALAGPMFTVLTDNTNSSTDFYNIPIVGAMGGSSGLIATLFGVAVLLGVLAYLGFTKRR